MIREVCSFPATVTGKRVNAEHASQLYRTHVQNCPTMRNGGWAQTVTCCTLHHLLYSAYPHNERGRERICRASSLLEFVESIKSHYRTQLSESCSETVINVQRSTSNFQRPTFNVQLSTAARALDAIETDLSESIPIPFRSREPAEPGDVIRSRSVRSTYQSGPTTGNIVLGTAKITTRQRAVVRYRLSSYTCTASMCAKLTVEPNQQAGLL